MTPQTLDDYRALPYRPTCERVNDESGTYFVCQYPDLPGLSADGVTRAEAVHNGQLAFDDFIRALLEWGETIPLPPNAERVAKARGLGERPTLRLTSTPAVAAGNWAIPLTGATFIVTQISAVEADGVSQMGSIEHAFEVA